MTMHRVVNYGSFMQAYALKRVLESLGATVRFADFSEGQPRHQGVKVAVPTAFDKLKKLPHALLDIGKQIAKRRYHRALRRAYKRVAYNLLNIQAEPDLDYRCDLMVIGSDEVFNYTQNHAWGYVPALFGHGIAAKRLISYAASAGYATLDDVQADGMAEELGAGLNKFDAVAVRDRNTYDLVKGVSGIEATMVVDPTLLFDFDEVTPSLPQREPFMIVYAYDGRMDSPEEIAAVMAFARSKGLRVLSPGFFHHWVDENIVVSPFELLAYFKAAAYVVTDTFHGSIFSIKAQKQFVSVIRGANRWGANAGKLGFLLEQLGLASRSLPNLAQLDALLDTPIDYTVVNDTRTKLAEQSKAYLMQQLASV
jgi:hypothetical protein